MWRVRLRTLAAALLLLGIPANVFTCLFLFSHLSITGALTGIRWIVGAVVSLFVVEIILAGILFRKTHREVLEQAMAEGDRRLRNAVDARSGSFLEVTAIEAAFLTWIWLLCASLFFSILHDPAGLSFSFWSLIRVPLLFLPLVLFVLLPIYLAATTAIGSLKVVLNRLQASLEGQAPKKELVVE